MGIFIALQNLSNEQHPYSTIQSHKSMTSKRVLLYSAIQLHKSIIAVKWFCALKPYQFSKTSVFEASPMNPLVVLVQDRFFFFFFRTTKVQDRFECWECEQFYANPRHYVSCTASLNLDKIQFAVS